MSKKNPDNMFHYLLIAVLSITASLGFVSFILLNSQADTSSTSANINNQAPTVDSVTFSATSGGAAAATAVVPENSTATYYVHGTYTDNNGCDEVSDGAGTGAGNGELKLVLYRSGATGGTACTADNNDCYITDDDANCTITNCTGGTDITADYECTVALEYYADPTDASIPADDPHGTGGSDYGAQNWIAYVYADDTSDASGTNTTTMEVSSVLALDVTGTINYGSLNLGATSAEQTVVVTNTGNVRLDWTTGGTDMSCTVGTISKAQQEYSLTTGFTYGNGTTLTATGTPSNVAADLDARTNDATPATDNDYWLIQIPSNGLSGSCTGTNTYTAATV